MLQTYFLCNNCRFSGCLAMCVSCSVNHLPHWLVPLFRERNPALCDVTKSTSTTWEKPLPGVRPFTSESPLAALRISAKYFSRKPGAFLTLRFSRQLSQVAQSLKRPMASPVVTTESKRPSIIQATSAPPNATVSKLTSPKVLSFTVDPNKTAEQLTVLRSSYTQCPFPEEEEVRKWRSGFMVPAAP